MGVSQIGRGMRLEEENAGRNPHGTSPARARLRDGQRDCETALPAIEDGPAPADDPLGVQTGPVGGGRSGRTSSGSAPVEHAASRAGDAASIIAAIQAKAKTYDVRMAGVIANRSAATDEIDRFNAATGLERLAHFPDLDAIRRSRLKKCTLFEMDPTPEIDAACAEYKRLAALLWAGCTPLDARPMKDRDIFEFLGFE